MAPLNAVGVAASAAVCVGLSGLAWGLVEAHAFAIRRVAVPILATGSGPLRVLHLSDLHLTPRQGDKIRWTRSLADLHPDLVVATGDFLGHADAVPSVLSALEPLLGVPGAFVLGSNDYFAPRPLNPFQYFTGPSKLRAGRGALPTSDLVDGLTAGGWLDLTNSRGTLDIGERVVSLVGLDDPHLRRDAMPEGSPSASDLHLGVTHAPYARALNALRSDGAQLVLAGHTHGGQVCLPVKGALVTNCDLDTGRARGLSGWPGARPDAPGGEKSLWLHVSAGVGTSPFAPVRFACRPEATLLTLTPSEQA